MSDFDFDELDKAVAGAITTQAEPIPATTVATSAPVAAVEEAVIPEVVPVKPVEREESEELKTPPSPTVELKERVAIEKPSPSTPPATRRSSGRFMDVVHPSSDMRSKTTTFTPPTPSQPEVKEKPQPVEEDTLSLPEDAPLESPFLADAKVEKRPLGSMPGSGSATMLSLLEEPEELPPVEALDEAPAQPAAMPDPIDFAAHASALPSESEDTGTTVAATFEETLYTDTQSEQSSSEEFPVEIPESKESALEYEESKPSAELPEEPTGPTSITQQYTEQPGTEQVSGAIYDTETYHQAVTPVAKKHSGAFTALWIGLLVILGAGAGVAFYLFVLPLL